ncbi:hypothetical protein EV421DRAFT_1908288 [Armillaria borealis]|uniref:Uncharacterized protein n=1 Tax=Armillaria borealis TaxID=47425 RepID=A0AA39J4M3_9AGAR|nr:hypothetical protein EV421DRAFT_1908288 [Armillaria borealis]
MDTVLKAVYSQNTYGVAKHFGVISRSPCHGNEAFCAKMTHRVPASEGGELGSPRLDCLGRRFGLPKIPAPSLFFDGLPPPTQSH